MKIIYRAKRKDNNEWVEGVPCETTPFYCFQSDYEKLGQTFVMVYADFADWGMPRPIKTVEIDPNTIQQYIGFINGHKAWKEIK